MKSISRLLVLGLCWFAGTACGCGQEAKPLQGRNVTFVSTSDSHYKAFESAAWNEYNRETIEEINRIAARQWPEKLGGGAIDTPRGVVLLGDCIDDGDKVAGDKDYTAEQFKAFLAQMGLDGTEIGRAHV